MEENTSQVQPTTQRRTAKRRSSRRPTPGIVNGQAGIEKASSGTGTAQVTATAPKHRAKRRSSGSTQSSAGTPPWNSNAKMITATAAFTGGMYEALTAGVSESQLIGIVRSRYRGSALS